MIRPTRPTLAEVPLADLSFILQHNPNRADTMTSHLIDLETGVWDDDYDAFFAARCKAISDELQNWIPLRPCDDAKPVVIGDDSDPDEVEEDSEFDAVADHA